MAKWIELTDASNQRAIFVNMDQASSFQRIGNDKATSIWFLAGHPDGVVNVVETPEQIISSMKVRLDA